MQNSNDKLVPDDSGIKRNKRFGLNVLFLLGLAALVVITIIYYYFREHVASSVSQSRSEDGDFRLFPLLPIWFAAFIPILVSNNNKRPAVMRDRRRILILAALVAGVILGLVVYIATK